MRLLHTSRSTSTFATAAEDIASPTRPDGYRRYWTHCVIISCWSIVIIAYLVVLNSAYQHTDHFGGKPASDKQILAYDILVFVRTLLSTMHIPIMTGVLMSVVPWTMMEVSSKNPSLYSRLVSTALPRKTRLPELFYLSDATWGSAPGWFTGLSSGIKVRAISWPWIHLSTVVLVSYLGFPLLSLAYRIDGENNFVEKDISVPGKLGYAEPSIVGRVALTYFSRGRCTYCQNVEVSSMGGADIVLYQPPKPEMFLNSYYLTSPFNDGGALITSRLGSNVQVETVGVQIESSTAIYGVQNRTLHNLYQHNSMSNKTGDLNFDSFFDASNLGASDSSKAILSALRCSDSCSGDEICHEQKSNKTLFETYLVQNSSGDYRTFVQTTKTYTGALLSCVKISPIEGSPMKAMASVNLAVEGPGNYTKIATCNVTVIYAQRTVNEAARTYIEPQNIEKGPPENQDKDALSPAQLLNISSSAFTTVFHKDLSNSSLPIFTDGLIWIPLYSTERFSDQYDEGLTLEDWTGYLYSSGPNSRALAISGTFTENMLIWPIQEAITTEGFFRNVTRSAIVPGTVMYLRHGRVPVELAIFLLVLPIVWTLILAILSTKDRRWTERLDSFSMFKLGSDYGGLLKEHKLSSLEETSKVLGKLSGVVLVTPEDGKAELKPSTRVRESAWETELAVMASYKQEQHEKNRKSSSGMSKDDLAETQDQGSSHALLLESDISETQR
ncbi:hypothetical protein PVAG01_01594 [Phlyctema vagabunda]|uniref:Uncharacterized protein n=1 Tax=Phlyctema vagabunda TaxID=108571 RepID=A0ABR4PXJ8_9HELO